MKHWFATHSMKMQYLVQVLLPQYLDSETGRDLYAVGTASIWKIAILDQMHQAEGLKRR